MSSANSWQFYFFSILDAFNLAWMLWLEFLVLCSIKVVIMGILLLFLILQEKISNFHHRVSCLLWICLSLVQFSRSVCPTLCNPMNHNTPGLPVHHQLLEFTETHVHRVGDANQPSHPLWSPFPPALNLSQHQGLFKWVSSSHQVAKVLELQLQHQSFQWTPRTDLL